MTTTTTTTGTLYIALELGQDKWLLAAATQAAQKPRLRGLPARSACMFNFTPGVLPGVSSTGESRGGLSVC